MYSWCSTVMLCILKLSIIFHWYSFALAYSLSLSLSAFLSFFLSFFVFWPCKWNTHETTCNVCDMLIISYFHITFCHCSRLSRALVVVFIFVVVFNVALRRIHVLFYNFFFYFTFLIEMWCERFILAFGVIILRVC